MIRGFCRIVICCTHFQSPTYHHLSNYVLHQNFKFQPFYFYQQILLCTSMLQHFLLVPLHFFLYWQIDYFHTLINQSVLILVSIHSHNFYHYTNKSYLMHSLDKKNFSIQKCAKLGQINLLCCFDHLINVYDRFILVSDALNQPTKVLFLPSCDPQPNFIQSVAPFN